MNRMDRLGTTGLFTDRGGEQYPIQLEDDIPLEMCSSI